MSWWDDFDLEMRSLGLAVPHAYFSDTAAAIDSVKSIQTAVQIGGDVTLGELIGAGMVSEQFTVAAGVLASYYVGACIGASIYASACAGEDLIPELVALGVDLSRINPDEWRASPSESGGTPA